QIWTPNDLLDLGARSAIDKALQRLVLAGDVRRIDRGLYDVPRTNSLTGKPSSPDYTAIIDAVARREKARFLPDGITAASQLGLTDAVPAKVTVHIDARLRPFTLTDSQSTSNRPLRAAFIGRAGRLCASFRRFIGFTTCFRQTTIQSSSGSGKFWMTQNKERRFRTIFAAVSMPYQCGCVTW